MAYKPRNVNLRTRDAPKATRRWFDERKEKPKSSCGFYTPEPKDG
jgi:hypothetical protein